MVAFPNNTGSLSKNNRQNSTGSVWSSGASGSQSGEQRVRADMRFGKLKVADIRSLHFVFVSSQALNALVAMAKVVARKLDFQN